MRTIEVKLYKFSELSDKAKERAISDWRNTGDNYNDWTDDVSSLKAFLDHFRIQERGYSVSPYSYSYVKTNAETSHFRGVQLKQFTGDEMPTGYCQDYPLWHTFYTEFKATGNAHAAFICALDAWVKAVCADMEYQDSDEAITESIECNEYEFDEKGVMV